MSTKTMSPTKLVLLAPQMFSLLEGFSAGLISLANFVQQECPETEIELLDLSDVPSKELKVCLNEVMEGSQRIVVGITTTTASYQSALRIAKMAHELRPSSVIVLGGHHASAQADCVVGRHHEFIDAVVSGEGERALAEIVRGSPMELVPNAVFWQHGQVKRNAEAPMLNPSELDALGVDFEGQMLGRPGKFDHVTYVSARGCPLKCSFCAVANQTIRAKSIEAVIQDIEHLCSLGFKHIAIEDNFFAQSPKRTQALCLALIELRKRVDFDWDCQTRVESMRNHELAALMRAAGCTAVYLGVESLNPDHLRYLGKTSNPDQYLHLLEERVVPGICQEGLDCFLNLQVGIPEEEEEHWCQSAKALRALVGKAAVFGRRITVFPMLHVVYPGTRHFTDLRAQGLLKECSFEEFTEWEDRETPILRWMGEQFAHGTGGIPIGLLRRDLLPDVFEIDSNAVANTAVHLKKLESTGAHIFSYGRYLVQGKA